MQHPALDRLNALLKGVSRSFYLTLRILPRSLRTPIGLAYLFARAADTIADTTLISSAERLTLLEQFRSLFQRYEVTTLGMLRRALVGPHVSPLSVHYSPALMNVLSSFMPARRMIKRASAVFS